MATDIGLRGAATLAAKALSHGGERLTLGSTEWDVSGDCIKSTVITVHGRYFRGQRNHPEGGFTSLHGAVKRVPAPHAIFLHVRCGKCEKCRRRRRRIWTIKAVAECKAAIRTWFVTLTARPENQFLYETRARKRCRQRGYDFDTLSESERFAELCQEMGVELTKYMKRVRKESGAKLRALWVFEAHKSGLPHIHGLVHEVEAIPVTWSVLNKQWKDGFSVQKLLTDETGAHYATKYLAKEAECRVRASRWYGRQKERPEAIAEPEPVRRDLDKVVFRDLDGEDLARWSRQQEREARSLLEREGSTESEERPDLPEEADLWVKIEGT